MSDATAPKIILRDPMVRLVAGKITLRGLVSGHPEADDGTHFETAPLVGIDFINKTAATKGLVYHYEGELSK